MSGKTSKPGKTMRFLAKSPDMSIIDEGRLSRPTVADAVEILRSQPNFSQNVRSTIKIGRFPLPSGDVPFLVMLECKELGLAVTLPTSKRFRATLVHSPTTSTVEEDITLLDRAVVELTEDQAHVVLPDGRRLRNVVIIPYHLPPHGDRPRELQSMRLQWAVIEHTVRMCKAEDRWYRYFDRNLAPGVRVIDFNALRDLELPPLSDILHDMQLNNEVLNDTSRQTVANTLREWGLRLPSSRNRRGKAT